MEKKTATLQKGVFSVDGFSKSSPLPWCSGLRMALLSCCNALPPNCHTSHSVALGPLALDKGPDWGCFDTSASNHQSILIVGRWWTNGSAEGCPRHKSDHRGDSAQNRWIVTGFPRLAASLVSPSRATLFIIWERVKRMPYQPFFPAPHPVFFFFFAPSPKPARLDSAMNCFPSQLLV